MDNYLMSQCTLKKGNKTTTSWIPHKFAMKGRILKLKDDNGWEVISVGDLHIPARYILERERDYLNQREASDI